MKPLQLAVREQQLEAQAFAFRLAVHGQEPSRRSWRPWRPNALRSVVWLASIGFCAAVWAAVIVLGVRLFF